ncbi:MAG: hypothetical protein JO100_15015 [Pseudonocardia sp.]|nr:hypothetical protein [Pseudonocardia sp.]
MGATGAVHGVRGYRRDGIPDRGGTRDGRRAMTRPAQADSPILWMTSCRDGFDHAVRAREFDAGSASGRYAAVCGMSFFPAR